jgi:hypothetical protein
MLTKDEVNEVFREAHLIENYNFLEEDLFKLANLFIEKAKPRIEAKELETCVSIAQEYNHLVATKIKEIRPKLK